ncbi:MAG TPA: SlyX family protein [Methylococcaceae bacterium]|jgi:SlyX protein|nr:SlyX family protein [Methylococcaceae bacterium]
MIENRIINIETKLAYQEDAVRELNDVLCLQQKQIDQLEATIKLLLDRIRYLSAAGDLSRAADEEPPDD